MTKRGAVRSTIAWNLTGICAPFGIRASIRRTYIEANLQFRLQVDLKLRLYDCGASFAESRRLFECVTYLQHGPVIAELADDL